MTLVADIGALDPGALVELFEIDLTPFGGTLVRFHAGTNELNAAVVWDGNTYDAYPIEATGFEWSGQGTLPRPKLTVANVTSLISGYILNYQDLLGAKVTRKRTLVKYLDAVNFADGNPSADPTQAFADEVYYINQKTSETKIAVQFELAAAFDVAGVKLPRRQIVQNQCPWIYKSSECSWAPDPVTGPFFDKNDASTTSANDQCSKRLTGCKARFGQYAALPYGGFPSAAKVRI